MSGSVDIDVPLVSEQMLSSYNKQFVCKPGTNLVVEGFPRSGNTFSVDYLIMLTSQAGAPLKIAHHTHDARNVLLGQALNVPTVVLLRSPVDAITSYMIYSGADIRVAIERYVDFYATVRPLKQNVLIALFENYVRDFNSLITDINARFDLNVPLSTDPSADAETAKEMERKRGSEIYSEEHFAARVAVPNEERKRLAADLKEQVAEMLVKRPRATNLYNFLRKPPQETTVL